MTSDSSGIAAHLSDDAWRDALGLITALCHDDGDGQDVILANAGLLGLASALAAIATGSILAVASQQAGAEVFERMDPEQQFEIVKLGLADGLRKIGAPVPPLPSFGSRPRP